MVTSKAHNLETSNACAGSNPAPAIFCLQCKKQHSGSYGSGRFCSVFCSRSFVSKYVIGEKEVKCIRCNSIIIVSKRSCKKFCDKCTEDKYIERQNKKLKRFDLICIICEQPFIGTKSTTHCKKCKCRKGGLESAKKQVRRSKSEIYFSNLCKEKFEVVKTNEQIFNGWDADVIIEDFKIAVLWNGPWHHRKCNKKHSVKQVKNRDKIKIDQIKKCGYIPYIIDDIKGKFNKQFVENEFRKFVSGLTRNFHIVRKLRTSQLTEGE